MKFPKKIPSATSSNSASDFLQLFRYAEPSLENEINYAKAMVSDSMVQGLDTDEERKLIIKLDLLIVPYAFLSYWTKYIDQANLSRSILGPDTSMQRTPANYTKIKIMLMFQD